MTAARKTFFSDSAQKYFKDLRNGNDSEPLQREKLYYHHGSAEGAQKVVNEYVHVGSKTLMVREQFACF